MVAQVYDPRRVIAEFTAPAVLSERGQQPSMVVNWSKARASVVGLPGMPRARLIVFDDPALDRIAASVQAPLARAKHAELHGRFAENSTPERPVIETALQIVRRQHRRTCIRCWPSRSTSIPARCSAG